LTVSVTVCVCVCVGLCPDWEDWSPTECTTNATEAMDAAEQWLDIPQVPQYNAVHTVVH